MLEPMPQEPMFPKRDKPPGEPRPCPYAGWSIAISAILTVALITALHFQMPVVTCYPHGPVMLA